MGQIQRAHFIYMRPVTYRKGLIKHLTLFIHRVKQNIALISHSRISHNSFQLPLNCDRNTGLLWFIRGGISESSAAFIENNPVTMSLFSSLHADYQMTNFQTELDVIGIILVPHCATKWVASVSLWCPDTGAETRNSKSNVAHVHRRHMQADEGDLKRVSHIFMRNIKALI